MLSSMMGGLSSPRCSVFSSQHLWGCLGVIVNIPRMHQEEPPNLCLHMKKDTFSPLREQRQTLVKAQKGSSTLFSEHSSVSVQDLSSVCRDAQPATVFYLF